MSITALTNDDDHNRSSAHKQAVDAFIQKLIEYADYTNVKKVEGLLHEIGYTPAGADNKHRDPTSFSFRVHDATMLELETLAKAAFGEANVQLSDTDYQLRIVHPFNESGYFQEVVDELVKHLPYVSVSSNEVLSTAAPSIDLASDSFNALVLAICEATGNTPDSLHKMLKNPPNYEYSAHTATFKVPYNRTAILRQALRNFMEQNPKYRDDIKYSESNLILKDPMINALSHHAEQLASKGEFTPPATLVLEKLHRLLTEKRKDEFFKFASPLDGTAVKGESQWEEVKLGVDNTASIEHENFELQTTYKLSESHEKLSRAIGALAKTIQMLQARPGNSVRLGEIVSKADEIASKLKAEQNKLNKRIEDAPAYAKLEFTIPGDITAWFQDILAALDEKAIRNEVAAFAARSVRG